MPKDKSEKISEDLDKDLEEKIEAFLRKRSRVVQHELKHFEKSGRKFVFSFGSFRILKKVRNQAKNLLKKPWYFRVVTYLAVLFILIAGAWYGQKLVKAATYTWFQTDWTGGASTSAPFPIHPTDQNSWNKYYSKGGMDTGSAELKLERFSN